MISGGAPGSAAPYTFLASVVEAHHQVPRCLLRLHDRAHSEAPGAEITGEGIEAWLEYEMEAVRYGVSVDIERADLEALVAASVVILPAPDHRRGHAGAGDFARWGRRGGQTTLSRYGTAWYSLLALRRWGRISAAELQEARPLRPARRSPAL